jgi:hypothetical protein
MSNSVIFGVNQSGNDKCACSRAFAGVFFVLEIAASFFISLSFVASAVPHLGNPYYFLGTVISFGIELQSVAIAVAILIPALQITLAIALVFRCTVEPAHWLAFTLLLVFAVLRFSYGASSDACGCFGTRGDLDVEFGSIIIRDANILLAISAARMCVRYGACIRWGRPVCFS